MSSGIEKVGEWEAPRCGCYWWIDLGCARWVKHDIRGPHGIDVASAVIEIPAEDLGRGRCGRGAGVKEPVVSNLIEVPLVPLRESLYEHLVALEDVEARSEQEGNWVASESSLQTGLPLDWEPYELPEYVRPELGQLDEQLSVVELIELKARVGNKFLLEVVVVADGPVAEALVLVVALLLGEVEAHLHLYLVVKYHHVFIADVEDLPRGIVGGDLGGEDGWVLHFHEEGFSGVCYCEDQVKEDHCNEGLISFRLMKLSSFHSFD